MTNETHKSKAESVYIAGPMAGVEDFNYPLFNAVAADLRKNHFQVENPAEFGEFDEDDTPVGGNASGPMRARYMERDLPIVASCDAILLLPNWEQSKGANMELLTALMVGNEVWEYVMAVDDEGNAFPTIAYSDARPNLWLILQHVEEAN